MPFARRTWPFQSRGSENIGGKRTNSGFPAVCAVHRSAAKTPEFLGNFRIEFAWRERLSGDDGGGGGIRTRDTVSRIHTFQACAFNHSATPPRSACAPPAGPLNLPAMRISAKGALHYSAARRQRKQAPVLAPMFRSVLLYRLRSFGVS